MRRLRRRSCSFPRSRSSAVFSSRPRPTISRITQEAVLRAKDAEIAQDQFDRERNREKAAFWANTAKVTFCLSIGAFIVGVLSAIHGLS